MSTDAVVRSHSSSVSLFLNSNCQTILKREKREAKHGQNFLHQGEILSSTSRKPEEYDWCSHSSWCTARSSAFTFYEVDKSFICCVNNFQKQRKPNLSPHRCICNHMEEVHSISLEKYRSFLEFLNWEVSELI